MILGTDSACPDIENQGNIASVVWRMAEVDTNAASGIPLWGTEAACVVETMIQDVHWTEESMEVLDGKFLYLDFMQS